MPQICAWFSDALFLMIDETATRENVAKSKVVVALVEKAIKAQETEQLLSEKDQQLGMALQALNTMQNEILPPLKLLTEGNAVKPGVFARLFKRQ